MTEQQQHEQRSAEWHQQRVGRVTGSRVGAILHLAPYASRDDVLRSMVREYHNAHSEFVGNVATSYGNDNEPAALMAYEQETRNFVDKAYFVTYEDWLGASPDGYIGDDGLLEIKCPFSRRKDALFVSIKDQPHYYAQIQIQMMVTGRKWCDFYQWSKHGSKLERVDIDHEWLDENLPLLKQFHAEYLDELNNPAHLELIRKEINTNETKLLLDEYDQLKDAVALAQERQKEVLELLVSASGGQSSLLWGRKLTQVEKAGSVSYAKLVKDHAPDVDVEPYRGKSSTFWKLT